MFFYKKVEEKKSNEAEIGLESLRLWKVVDAPHQRDRHSIWCLVNYR